MGMRCDHARASHRFLIACSPHCPARLLHRYVHHNNIQHVASEAQGGTSHYSEHAGRWQRRGNRPNSANSQDNTNSTTRAIGRISRARIALRYACADDSARCRPPSSPSQCAAYPRGAACDGGPRQGRRRACPAWRRYAAGARADAGVVRDASGIAEPRSGMARSDAGYAPHHDHGAVAQSRSSRFPAARDRARHRGKTARRLSSCAQWQRARGRQRIQARVFSAVLRADARTRYGAAQRRRIGRRRAF